MNEPPSLLRNDVTGNGHWLKVKLVGVKSNRSAIGARVIARYGGRTQAQEVLANRASTPPTIAGSTSARRGGDRGSERAVAERRDREDRQCRRRSTRRHSRRRRHRPQTKIHWGRGTKMTMRRVVRIVALVLLAAE